MAISEMNVVSTLLINLWRGCMIAVALLLCGCGSGSGITPKEITEETGYEGIARVQPYLAAERMFAKLGWESEAVHTTQDLPYGGTLVLAGETSIGQTISMRAIEWVEKKSGHLILILRGTEAWRDDWDKNLGEIFASYDDLIYHPVFRKLGIKPAPKSNNLISNTERMNAEIIDDTFEYDQRFELALDATKTSSKPDVLVGKKEEAKILSVPVSTGRITVVCDGSPFRNRYIDENDHAELLVALAQLEHGAYGLDSWNRSIRFLLSGNESFFTLLWQHYWMALVALALLIIAWLWRNILRFGPLQKSSTNEVRQFSEHLKMTGKFLWRQRLSADLLLPMRRAILNKLQRHQGMDLQDDDARIMERLANLSQLPYERVANAWQSNRAADGKTLQTIIHDLQIIEKSL